MKVKTLTYNQPITLKTRWTYDSWNRVREIIYPDGEKVSYHYNKGGLLKSMEGDKNGYITQYIRDIQYDHYDQRVFMEYGNGVTYNYTYNPETRRLDNLYSESTQQNNIVLQNNTYKYDNVGNITQIKGYGTDPFEHNYNYDASYRLENANGNGTWQGNNLTYEQSFKYTPSGRIDNKKTTSQKLSNQFGLYNEDYDNTYTYDVNDNPYAVRHITDNANGLDYDFNWDQKGNMIYASNTKRTLCWTEDNRLQAVKDNQMGAYYNYDASGERNLKLTGAVVHMSQNGVPYDYVMLESPTLYASGLITINERGYTKHYFEENKRVCSNIGGGFRDAGYDIMDSIELITPFLEQWRNAKDGIFKTFEQCIKSPVDLENTQDKIVKVMKDHEKDRNEEEYQFYYTNDHLGSSTYITDQDGNITQTLAYLPYGEDWVDLDNQPPYLTPYKFNGKEKDQETGYNNYGARYYYDWASIWLSVDPMSDKYPHLTSYNYCANNPVMLIDPDGEDPIYAKRFWGGVKKIGDDGRKGSGSYFVNGSVAKEVKAATKAGKAYSGSLAPSDKVSPIPTGGILEDVRKSVRNTTASGETEDTRVEHGGHSLFGDASARLWDKGSPMVLKIENGQKTKTWSITPFQIDGKQNVGGPTESIEFIWHVQPVSSGESGKDRDALKDDWRPNGFKGNPFIIGTDGNVNFYNEKGSIIKVDYNDFIRMGEQK